MDKYKKEYGIKRETRLLKNKPNKKRPVCTISLFKDVPITQPLYRCETCRFSETDTICRGCAEFCHQGHDIVEVGSKIGYCHCGYGTRHCFCFLMNPVEGDEFLEGPRQCDFNIHERQYHPLQIYQCKYCDMQKNEVVCGPCFFLCHRHNTGDQEGRSNPSAYCDCGDPVKSYKCYISPPSMIKPPPLYCTYLLTGPTKFRQTFYKCKTCKADLICEGCMTHCHKDHNVIKVDKVDNKVKEPFCQCGANLLAEPCYIIKNIEPAQ